MRDIPGFEVVIEWMMELKKGSRLINSMTYLQMIKESPRPSRRDGNRGFSCHAPDMIMHVAADVTVAACRVHQEALGNVSRGLAMVWVEGRERRKEMATECRGCLFFGYVENSLLYDFVPEVMRHYQWM